MATVVAENIKEAWEVEDTCVCWCVCVHVRIKVKGLALKDKVSVCETAVIIQTTRPFSCT